MTTPNRKYNVPDKGDEDWHEPVNENWHAIDADMQEALDNSSNSNGASTDSPWDHDSTHVIDPDTDDLGAALADVIDDAESRDAIIIPPGSYETYTEPVLNKEMFISSTMARGGNRWSYPVFVEAQDDIPFLTGAPGIGFSLTGVEFRGNGYHNGWGVKMQSNCDIAQCRFDRIGTDTDGNYGDGIYVQPNDGGVNGSRIQDVDVTSCKRHGIKIAPPADDSSSPNALDIHVRDGRNTEGFVVHYENGWGSNTVIQHVGTGGEGGFYTDSRQHHVRLVYASSGVYPLVHFDTGSYRNFAETIHTGGYRYDDHVLDEGENNTVISYRRRNWVSSPGDQWTWSDHAANRRFYEDVERDHDAKVLLRSYRQTNAPLDYTFDTASLWESMSIGEDYPMAMLDVSAVRNDSDLGDQEVRLQWGNVESDYEFLVDGPDGIDYRTEDSFLLFQTAESSSRPSAGRFWMTTSTDGIGRHRIGREYAANDADREALVRGHNDGESVGNYPELRVFNPDQSKSFRHLQMALYLYAPRRDA